MQFVWPAASQQRVVDRLVDVVVLRPEQPLVGRKPLVELVAGFRLAQLVDRRGGGQQFAGQNQRQAAARVRAPRRLASAQLSNRRLAREPRPAVFAGATATVAAAAASVAVRDLAKLGQPTAQQLIARVPSHKRKRAVGASKPISPRLVLANDGQFGRLGGPPDPPRAPAAAKPRQLSVPAPTALPKPATPAAAALRPAARVRLGCDGRRLLEPLPPLAPSPPLLRRGCRAAAAAAAVATRRLLLSGRRVRLSRPQHRKHAPRLAHSTLARREPEPLLPDGTQPAPERGRRGSPVLVGGRRSSSRLLAGLLGKSHIDFSND